MTSVTSERLAATARRAVAILRERGEAVAVAESCTGGWLGRELTAEAGASDVFWGGVIVYDDAAKQRLLDVPSDLLAEHGAVSEAAAIRLAEAMRSRADTAWAVSITGVAGPGGGGPEKPVGTVWVAVSGPDGSTAMRRQLSGDRTGVRSAAVESALDDLIGRLGRAP